MELPFARSPGFFQQGAIDAGATVDVPVLGWGEHGGVDPDQGCNRFVPYYTRRRGVFTPVEVVPLPLLPPNIGRPFPQVSEVDLVYKKTKIQRHTKRGEAGVTLDFSRQISHFCWDHNSIAFQCMGRLLEPHCFLGDTLLMGKIRADVVRLTPLMQQLQTAPYQQCPHAHSLYSVRSFSHITRDWLQDVPPVLLARLVEEGMAEDWRELQFQASLTGGALSWTSYPGTSYGCLVYPRGAAMDILHFQQLRLGPSAVTLEGCAATFDVQERLLQVTAAQHQQTVLGVRSSYHLASWSFSAQDPPKPLCVLHTKTRSTSISASPHIAAEFCVCTESGTLYLWGVESGLQRVRQDPDTHYFRDDPSWRWGDFTSHPRVLTYADRTGVQLADVRVPNSQGSELFRIGQESSCQSGERVILPRCLRETNPAHTLVTTQFSMYIMDERFPLVPLVKWDHMLEGPPTYASIASRGASDQILLGTQNSQETLMVQYSGVCSGSCHLHLPAVYLPQISASLDNLPPLLPHQRDTALLRVQSPLAGLAAASLPWTEDQLLVFQLTVDGDVFIQRLSQEVGEEPADACGAAGPVCDSAPQEPGADHQSVCPDEADSCCSGSRQLGAQSRSNTTPFCQWLHEVYSASSWRGSYLRPRCKVYKLFPSEKTRERSEEVAGLRERLREVMKGGTLMPSVTTPGSHSLEVVHSESWKDNLSQRLTASWEERLALWWEDYLGLNKESKIQVLREKRRRQKLLKSRSPSQLSGSFTTSMASDYDTESCSQVSCVTDLDTAAPHCPPVPPTSLDCAKDVFQETGTSSILSSQHLQTKGIPREKRQTLRDFLSFLGDGPSTGLGPELPPSQSHSQRSQPPAKRSRMGF